MTEILADEPLFTAVLIQKDGKFFCYQPGLGIVAADVTAAGAYEKFSETRRSCLQEAERAGLLTSPPVDFLQSSSRRLRASRGGLARELGLFLSKACIVLLIVGAIGVAGVVEARHSISRLDLKLAQDLKKISLVDAVNKAAQHAQEMPEGRKEQLRRSIAILSRESEPLMKAWSNPPRDERQAPYPTSLPANTR